MEKRMMKKGKVSVVALFVLLLVSCSYASDDRQHKRRKSIPPSKALALNRVGSSVVFPMLGNVYPKGFYQVTLFVGQPPKPYFLDPDTGSDLTWLQCDAPCVHCTKAPHPPYKPSNDLVICKDPLCSSLHPPGHHDCKDPEQCDYFVEYADGSSSLGVLLRDVVPVNLTNGVQVRPRLAIGCGYDQIPGKYNYHPIDGVLGLGRGKSTIVSQLYNQGVVQNVLGHCLNSRGGFLFFGDDLYDSSRVVWTPMLSDDSYKHYSPGFAELTLDGKTTGFKNLRVIFDTGSTYTYLDSLAYQALISWVNGELARKPLKEDRGDALALCWKGRKPFKNICEVKKYFKPLALSFANGWKAKTQFELPPEAYLIISNFLPVKRQCCLGILNGTEVGLQNLNVIGDISMQDRMVIYDNEKQMIGWVPANCSRLPKPEAVIM